MKARSKGPTRLIETIKSRFIYKKLIWCRYCVKKAPAECSASQIKFERCYECSNHGNTPAQQIPPLRHQYGFHQGYVGIMVLAIVEKQHLGVGRSTTVSVGRSAACNYQLEPPVTDGNITFTSNVVSSSYINKWHQLCLTSNDVHSAQKRTHTSNERRHLLSVYCFAVSQTLMLWNAVD